jgi:hypothetical protein
MKKKEEILITAAVVLGTMFIVYHVDFLKKIVVGA